MRKIDIPIVAAGPGSQPPEADGSELDIMAMPNEMSTFSMPNLPEPEVIAERTEAKMTLEKVLKSMASYRLDSPSPVFDLGDLDSDNREIVDQVLGEGEVSVVLKSDENVHIQESAMAGIWRAQTLNADNQLLQDSLEIAAIPSVIYTETFDGMPDQLAMPDQLPPGVLNAPPLFAEINDKISQYRPDSMPHVINLTLLPQTEEDLQFLQTCLGEGRVTILSRGYGNCRISSTGTKNVWWVQYFNSQDTIILNTIEITSVPEVACASHEDINDSQQRLREILEVYA